MSKYYPLFEKAIEDGDICDEVRIFLVEDLNDCYTIIKELREDITIFQVQEKHFLLKNLCSLKNYLHFCTQRGLVSVKLTK